MIGRILKFIWRLIWKTALWFFLITFMWVLLYRWIDPPVTYLQLQQKWTLSEDQYRPMQWVDLENIPVEMHLAVISSEDQNFLDHWGIDFGAVEKAIEYNKTHDKTRGASTITQQTAKNVFLWPQRSWLRKGFEVYFTYMIELLWSKERIMEVYLNVIETGKGTFGIEQAAKKYFGISASKLNKSQCALITAAIPSPRKSNPANPSAYLNRRKEHVLRQMRYLGMSYFERHGKPEWPD